MDQFIDIAFDAERDDPRVIRVSGTLNAVDAPPVGSLAILAVRSMETWDLIVRNIRPGQNLSAQIEAVNYAITEPELIVLTSRPYPIHEIGSVQAGAGELIDPELRVALHETETDEEGVDAGGLSIESFAQEAVIRTYYDDGQPEGVDAGGLSVESFAQEGAARIYYDKWLTVVDDESIQAGGLSITGVVTEYA